MKPLFLQAISTVFVFILLSSFTSGTGSYYEVDVYHSTVKWVGTRNAKRVAASLKIKEGRFIAYSPNWSSSRILFSMKAITSFNVSDSTLTRDLRGESFFNVSQNPLATLEVIKGENSGYMKKKITARLTINNRSKEIVFTLKNTESGDRDKYTGKINIDHKSHGLSQDDFGSTSTLELSLWGEWLNY